MSYIVNAASKRTNASAASTPNERVTHQKSTAASVNTVIQKATKPSTVIQKPLLENSISKAINIVSEESAISISELTDDTRFDDIGVDSLLGLMVSSRIRDELDLDIDSTILLNLRTIGNFKALIQNLIGASEQLITATETLETDIATSIIGSKDVGSIWFSVLEIIAEESGIKITDLTADTSFSDIGVDSLLSLVVVSRMRDELDLDVPDQSLFLDFPTIESLKSRIVGGIQSPSNGSEPSLSGPSTESSSVYTPTLAIETPIEEAVLCLKKDSVLSITEILPPLKPAWSIILQGSPRSATERLFLFPDGCGAATSYLKLPNLSPSTAVIAFNSPFMK